MSKNTNPPQHPGQYIKDLVLPSGLSVTAAADLIGVGRPALSNLLNGNAALSAEMALRLEKTFGTSHEELLRLQAEFDAYQARTREQDIAVRAYVPSFRKITARAIEQWVDGNIEARSQLPVLLRKLAHSTGHELSCVDFPGYDNAQRKGWDGQIEAGSATPWIPAGRSGWEFGCDKNPKKKADDDYTQRVKDIPAHERTEMTFVFVTPRGWAGKDAWLKQKQALGNWKTVRAFDASDIEQWLEQSIPTQQWIAEQMGASSEGVESLDDQWRRWASVTNPELPKELFTPSVERHAATLKSWLEAAPASPLVICADSKAEALAFLSCALESADLAGARYKDRALVFSSPKPIRALLSASSPFIPIVVTEEAEREIGGIPQKVHTIVVRPRNTVNAKPDIALQRLDHEAFRKALDVMDIRPLDADALARASGRSPTVLRRILSPPNSVIRTPPWAQDAGAIRHLIPMLLVGAWHVQSKSDCEVLRLLGQTSSYDDIEQRIAHQLTFDDSPVWSLGQFRGVSSKIDALFAAHAAMTPQDIENFLVAAEIVLSEADPSLDLPEDRRWAASLYGKTREYSRALREGLSESIVLLAIHGNNLFRDRLGIDVQARINRTIRNLLTPLTLQTLLSHQADLPLYAEAAPDEFLSILEDDLQRPDPQVLGLLKPANTGVLGGSCYRTGLLWALEALAWRPERLVRVARILAKLAQRPINDNWANKPDNSLRSIFRSWMPQTAASLEERKKALEILAKRFPSLAWQVCIDQLTPGSRVGDYNYRPRWRDDAWGAGEPVTRGEDYEFCRHAADLALAWPSHDEKTLGDLVERLPGLPETDHPKVWSLIVAWIATGPDDAARAALRERIRRSAFTRRARYRGMTAETRDGAREAYAALAPRDAAIRHQWLFKAHWVDESLDEIEDENLDYQAREERIRRERVAALGEIWGTQGIEGIRSLVATSEAPAVVGAHMAEVLGDRPSAVAFLDQWLSVPDANFTSPIDDVMRGFLWSISASERVEVYSTLTPTLSRPQIARLLKCLPFEQQTWALVDAQPDDVRTSYWRDVHPGWFLKDSPDVSQAVDRLLQAQRPRAAFHAVHGALEALETARLKQVLQDIGRAGVEEPGTFQIDPYYISKALDILGARPGVTEEEMAQLEFRFLRALDHSEHGIPNLEKQVASSPALFMQAMALAFRRSDDAADPPELGIDAIPQNEATSIAAYALLDKMKRVPGTTKDGTIDTGELRNWVVQVRSLCAKYARVRIGDERIGQLLAAEKSPGADGVWPPEPVREVLEEIASPEVATGMCIGVYNSRGVHYRAEGGAEERMIATTYRRWSEQLAFEYPYVSNLLAQIANEYDRDATREDSEAAVRSRLRW